MSMFLSPARLACLGRTAACCLLLLLITSLAWCQEDVPAANATDASAPAQASDEVTPEPKLTTWRLKAEEMAAQQSEGVYSAKGNVLLTQGRNTLSAQQAQYNQKTGWVWLKDDVTVHWDDYDMYAEEAEFDLANRVGWLKNGFIFARKNHIYVRGQHIDKVGPQSFAFQQAKVTACDGESPAWSVEADSGDITVDGYANVWGARFKVHGAPVLYSPWATLPVQATRQSGLLFPHFGSSSRLGVFYQQPLYLTFGPERDATVYLDGYSKRGIMTGLEYRTATDANSQSVWALDYIHDAQADATVRGMDEKFQSEGLVRPNHNRYWLRSKWDGWLGDPLWQLKVDLDYASDSTYLREFDIGHADYGRSRDMFLDRFGRGLDVVDSLTRTSTALLTRSFDDFIVNGKLAYTQNLRYMNDNLSPGDDPTPQRLPELSAYALKQRLLATPLEWEAASSVAYFHSNGGNRGGRLDLHPRLGLPVSNEYGSLIASAGLRETAYVVDDFHDSTGESLDAPTTSRTLADVRLAGFSELSRVYDLDDPSLTASLDDVGRSQWLRLRHAIQPRLEYNFISEKEQGRLPQFDYLDRIQPKNEIRYSITNLLDRKQLTVTKQENADGDETATTAMDYREFARLRLEQAYSLREAGRDHDRDQYALRPFSDVLAELTLWPASWLSLENRTFWSPYESRIVRHEHGLTLSRERVGSFSFGFDFVRPIHEYERDLPQKLSVVRLGTELYLPYDIYLRAKYQRDLEADKDVLKRLELTYRHQCYDLTLGFSASDYDTRVGIWVTILGFETPHLSF